MTDKVRLAFAVPKGFEDVALLDLQECLPVTRAAIFELASLHAGYVMLTVHAGHELDACLAAYASGSLWSVSRLLLSMGDGPLDLPDGLYAQLTSERQALPSKRSREITTTNADGEIKKASKRRGKRRLVPLDVEATPAEVAFLDAMDTIADTQKHSHEKLWKIWHECTHAKTGKLAKEISTPTFAIRFERREFLFSTLKSSHIARHLAELYCSQLQHFTHTEGIRADLTSPDYEIVSELIPQDAEKKQWTFFIGLALPLALQAPTHRPLAPLHGRTSLVPERAYCLARLHPLLAAHNSDKSDCNPTSRKKQSGLLFLDPCSGHGSIPAEICALSARKKLHLAILGGDNELPSLERAFANSSSSSLSTMYGLRGLDAGVYWDGRGEPFSGGLRDGILDGIVTDLPWGMRELSVNAVTKLYTPLLRTLARAAVPGAYGVFMCARDRIFMDALKNSHGMWELVNRRIVDVEGLQAHIFVLQRRTHCHLENPAT